MILLAEVDSMFSVDSVLKLANAGLPAIAIVVLFLTYSAVKQADGKTESYQKLVRTFMTVAIAIVCLSFVSSLISYFRPDPPGINAELLASGHWHQHWAGGNWLTEAEFQKQADGLHFRATTYRTIGGMKGRRIIEWASDGAVDVQAKKLSFTGTRTDLEKGAKMATKFEFAPGIALIGNYGGPNDSATYKLRFYDAGDDSVQEVHSVDEVSMCICPASIGVCDKCQR